eukprot:2939055-Amphidinium_carterae.1
MLRADHAFSFAVRDSLSKLQRHKFKVHWYHSKTLYAVLQEQQLQREMPPQHLRDRDLSGRCTESQIQIATSQSKLAERNTQKATPLSKQHYTRPPNLMAEWMRLSGHLGKSS